MDVETTGSEHPAESHVSGHCYIPDGPYVDVGRGVRADRYADAAVEGAAAGVAAVAAAAAVDAVRSSASALMDLIPPKGPTAALEGELPWAELLLLRNQLLNPQ